MIAFDLDGVFLSDINMGSIGLSTGLAFRPYLDPMFCPEFDYWVITGRPVQDKPITLEYLNKFRRPPVKVFHENLDIKNAAEYKASVINSNPDIKVFVESDQSQVEFLRSHCGSCKIIWYAEFVQYSLRTLL